MIAARKTSGEAAANRCTNRAGYSIFLQHRISHIRNQTLHTIGTRKLGAYFVLVNANELIHIQRQRFVRCMIQRKLYALLLECVRRNAEMCNMDVIMNVICPTIV